MHFIFLELEAYKQDFFWGLESEEAQEELEFWLGVYLQTNQIIHNAITITVER